MSPSTYAGWNLKALVKYYIVLMQLLEPSPAYRKDKHALWRLMCACSTTVLQPLSFPSHFHHSKQAYKITRNVFSIRVKTKPENLRYNRMSPFHHILADSSSTVRMPLSLECAASYSLSNMTAIVNYKSTAPVLLKITPS